MSHLFRYEVSALRFLQLLIERSKEFGTYRRHIMSRFIDDFWTFRDFKTGFWECLRQEWTSWDAVSTFVQPTAKGLAAAATVQKTIEMIDPPPQNEVVPMDDFRGFPDYPQRSILTHVQPFNMASSQDKLVNLQEIGALDHTYVPTGPCSETIILSYLESDIDFEMVQRQLLAVHYKVREFWPIEDD